MTNKLVQEAPFNPGYEDVSYQNETSPVTAELERFRKMNACYLNFSDVIVNYCKSSKISAAIPSS
jgi:hypothetical protein